METETENLINCPEFVDSEYEDILIWAKENNYEVKVSWNDTFINGLGEISVIPEFASWSLRWKFGFISFDIDPSKDKENEARKAAALFIYLYSRGVHAAIAERCAVRYVSRVS